MNVFVSPDRAAVSCTAWQPAIEGGHRRTVDGVPAAQRFAHPTQRGAPLLQTWNPLPLPPGHTQPPRPPPPTGKGSPAVTEAGPWLLDGGSPKRPQPPSVIARAWFERPLVDLETPGVLASLRAAQGRAGLWLCGSYTLPGVPLLENAARSGLR
jgi:hypothetical protein